MNTELSTRESFFTKDTLFYKTLFGLILTITLQNLIAYSVNMLDNIMLGSYSQNALSGAATVNQVFFMVQQTALPIGNALVALASQYWGQKQTQPIRELTGFGFPEIGIKGAAIGTLISRIAELLILLFYVAKMDTKIRLFSSSLFSGSREQVRSFLKVGIPIMITSLL